MPDPRITHRPLRTPSIPPERPLPDSGQYNPLSIRCADPAHNVAPGSD